MRATATTLIGFDSAWADRQRAPGAICALFRDGAGYRFEPPRLVGFDRAAELVGDWHRADRTTLLGIDQPTIVPNSRGARPCERVVASVMGWTGGGIQPAYRGKDSMFGDDAPIWRFLARIGFADDPERARIAARGGFVMELFPALALLGLGPAFAAAGAGPRYNPARATFRQEAWRAVCDVATSTAAALSFADVANWCARLDRTIRPAKHVQDGLDAVICLLVAALWLERRDRCAMIGDLTAGYIVAPVAPSVRARLEAAAAKHGVPIA